jgi:NAD+-dependent protein deacetylase SIR2
MKGTDLFDADMFADKTKTSLFFKFMAQLQCLSETAEPSPTHRFIRLMHSQGKLLRWYTQNIDGLEAKCGLSCDVNDANGKVVQLHGSLHYAYCTLCKSQSKMTPKFISQYEKGEAPSCEKCLKLQSIRETLGKRSITIGFVRPAIVLYHEEHIFGTVKCSFYILYL